MERMLSLVFILLPVSLVCGSASPYNESVACNTLGGTALTSSDGLIRNPDDPILYETHSRGGYSVFNCMWTVMLQPGQNMILEITQRLVKQSCDANVLTIGLKKNYENGRFANEILKYCGQAVDKQTLRVNETVLIIYRSTKESTSGFSISYNISGPCPPLRGPFKGATLDMLTATRAIVSCNDGLFRASAPTATKQKIICNRTTNMWSEEPDQCVPVAESGNAPNGGNVALIVIVSVVVVSGIVVAIVVAVVLSVRARRRGTIKESHIIADRLQVNALYNKELRDIHSPDDSHEGSSSNLSRKYMSQTDGENGDKSTAEAQLLLGERDGIDKEGQNASTYEEISDDRIQHPSEAENGGAMPEENEVGNTMQPPPVYAVVHKDKGDKTRMDGGSDDVEMKDNDLYGTE